MNLAGLLSAFFSNSTRGMDDPHTAIRGGPTPKKIRKRSSYPMSIVSHVGRHAVKDARIIKG